MANFAELLTEAAAEYPDRVALKLDDYKREIEPPER